ncbi:hypothetical protein EDB81DRAFT_761458 [Dactylonectria macrodidyma]|uniref:Uncharacterized protein n=1 Tax=Dactylonectria macrodidyma TaxID=307937 RepID=A0A9P9EQ03_9HYPO|nr:hypothetical protein EDB81DRAFT_761458 [Dactylonectria macrodidyma]
MQSSLITLTAILAAMAAPVAGHRPVHPQDQAHTPASIDIMIDAFSAIHGNPNGDKNKVINPVKWELTGKVNTQYAAPGASWLTAGGGSSPSQPTAGAIGDKCDGQTKLCNSGLTCMSLDGVCSDKGCNWGCTGWACSSTSICQKPNTCVNSVCKA